MDVLSFETEVRQLIGLQQEGEYWDFKKEWHQNKADLLHDIICMANNLSNQDGLIIIGVDEENDYSICDVINDPNRRKTQDIVSFLREKKFAGGIRPTAYELCNSGEFKIVRIGRTIRISKRSFDEWLDNITDNGGI